MAGADTKARVSSDHDGAVQQRRAGAGQHEDDEIDAQEHEVARASVPVELDQAGVDRGQGRRGEECRMAQRLQPRAPGVDEQRPQPRQGEARPAGDRDQRGDLGGVDDRPRPAPRQPAEPERVRRHRAHQRAQALRCGQTGVQPVRQSGDKHRPERPGRIEEIEARPVAQHARHRQRQSGRLHHRDRRREGRRPDQVVERHLQRAGGDDQPDRAGDFKVVPDQHRRPRQGRGLQQRPVHRRGHRRAGGAHQQEARQGDPGRSGQRRAIEQLGPPRPGWRPQGARYVLTNRFRATLAGRHGEG